MTTCTRCENSGFLNLHQISDDFLNNAEYAPASHDEILRWISDNKDHDVQVCDCCGDGEHWNGVPGEHSEDEETFDCM